MAGGSGKEPLWLRVLTPALLFLLGMAVRILPLHVVFFDGRVQPFGNDSFYHLRRIAYSLAHFPASLEFDRYMNFPDGGKPIWPPFFDWIAAAALRPFLGADSLRQMEAIAMWISPLLGALTVVALYFLARRFFDRRVATVAGLLLCVMSGHFWYSQIGFLDHHAAVALASTLVLAAGMSTLDEHLRHPLERRGAWRWSALTGLVFAGALLLWPGCVLFVAIVDIAFLLHLLSRPVRSHAAGFADRIGVIHAVGFVPLVFLAGPETWPQWSRMSPVVLSGFQPWLFGAGAFFGFACAALWRRPKVARTRARRIGWALGIGAALAAASAVVLPELLRSGLDAWAWLAKEDEFQSTVAESAPLFVVNGKINPAVALIRLSWFVFLVPGALVTGFWAVRRSRHRSQFLLFLWWTLCLSAVTIFQRRFFNSASVAVSLLFAWHVVGLYRLLPTSLKGTLPRRAVACGAIGCLVLLMLAPLYRAYDRAIANQVRALRGEPVHIPPTEVRRLRLVQTSRWLRRHTPPTSGWMDATQQPEYGILSPWPLGHVVKYEGRRPTVTDPFGDDHGRENFVRARRYFTRREPAAVEILERLGVRYVITQRQAVFLGDDPPADSMFFSLHAHDGRAFQPSDERLAPVSALARHRLVFESLPVAALRSGARSEFKIFEFVGGALVEGWAAPGALVEVELGVRTNLRRPIDYRTNAVADGSGRWSVRLPYANRGFPPSVTVAPFYELRSRTESGRLALEEAQVTGAARVEGPDLRPAARYR